MKLIVIVILNLLMQLPVLAEDFSNCGLTPQAQKLAKLIIENPEQQRIELKCNPLLAKVAQDKAKEMSELGRVTHIGHSSANQRLIDAGYPLAEIYPRVMSNQVEAISGGLSTAEEAFKGFFNSEDHHMHLMAKHEFYMLQNEIGVGFHYEWSSPHVEYWVVYIAHQEPKVVKNVEVAPSKD